jgi:hypothetical protein
MKLNPDICLKIYLTFRKHTEFQKEKNTFNKRKEFNAETRRKNINKRSLFDIYDFYIICLFTLVLKINPQGHLRSGIV